MAGLVFCGLFWWHTLGIVWRYYAPEQEDLSVLLKYWTDLIKPTAATFVAAWSMFPLFWIALGTDRPSGRDVEERANGPV